MSKKVSIKSLPSNPILHYLDNSKPSILLNNSSSKKSIKMLGYCPILHKLGKDASEILLNKVESVECIIPKYVLLTYLEKNGIIIPKIYEKQIHAARLIYLKPYSHPLILSICYGYLEKILFRNKKIDEETENVKNLLGEQLLYKMKLVGDINTRKCFLKNLFYIDQKLLNEFIERINQKLTELIPKKEQEEIFAITFPTLGDCLERAEHQNEDILINERELLRYLAEILEYKLEIFVNHNGQIELWNKTPPRKAPFANDYTDEQTIRILWISESVSHIIYTIEEAKKLGFRNELKQNQQNPILPNLSNPDTNMNRPIMPIMPNNSNPSLFAAQPNMPNADLIKPLIPYMPN